MQFIIQKIQRTLFYFSLCALSLILFGSSAFATPGINMPYGVSPLSHEIYNLHMAGFYVCCGIGVVVFGVLIYSLIKFRKSTGAKAAHFHEHMWVEVIWTTIPFLILVALAVPATIVLQHIHNTEKSALTIKVTGYQWKWKYDYLDQGISFFSVLATPQDQINNNAPKDEWYLLEVDHPLVVPINTKVKLLVTSDDVIHAWWVPEFGIKQDAIPGYVNENWIYITQPGTYRGQCGELCGANHAFMPIVVQAVSQKEFNNWVQANHAGHALSQAQSAQPMTEQELLALGKTQYEKTCAMCHQATGLGLPPTFPALKNSAIVTGPLDKNLTVVLKGVPGTAMQAFDEQLDNTALAAVITYIRQSWGNKEINLTKKKPVMVQPAEIEKAK